MSPGLRLRLLPESKRLTSRTLQRWSPLTNLTRLFLGGAIIIAGGTVIASSARSFWKAGTPIRPFEESSTLVITGLFRYSRNPMYVGMGGILFGLALVLGTATPFTVPPVFVVVITRRFVLHEEEALESHFGGRYTEYKSRVRRWL